MVDFVGHDDSHYPADGVFNINGIHLWNEYLRWANRSHFVGVFRRLGCWDQCIEESWYKRIPFHHEEDRRIVDWDRIWQSNASLPTSFGAHHEGVDSRSSSRTRPQQKQEEATDGIVILIQKCSFNKVWLHRMYMYQALVSWIWWT